jgi:hypothetical protein
MDVLQDILGMCPHEIEEFKWLHRKIPDECKEDYLNNIRRELSHGKIDGIGFIYNYVYDEAKPILENEGILIDEYDVTVSANSSCSQYDGLMDQKEKLHHDIVARGISHIGIVELFLELLDI